jgi:hypothetical protein
LKVVVAVLLFLGSIINVNAQTHTQTLYWLRYQLLLNFSPRLSWSNDIDNRRFVNPDVENQLIFHSRVHYKKDRWDFGGGVTYSAAYASIPENGFQNSRSELRPVIEASYEIPIHAALFAQRIRIDGRIFQAIPEVSLLEESEFLVRFRYRVQVRVPLKKSDSNATSIALRVADEIMVNERKNFYDQNRIYVSGEFYVNPKIALEAGYIYIHQQSLGREEFFERHVLRFSLVHRINLAD